MKSIPHANPRRSKTAVSVWRAAALLVLLSPVVGYQLSAQEAAPAGKQTEAALQLQEINFSYRSSAVPLSCSAIRNRVASILLTLGARQDIDVRVNNCDLVTFPEDPTDEWRTPAGPGRTSADPWRTSADPWQSSSNRLRKRSVNGDQSAYVSVRAMMPIEATPEVLAKIQKDKSRRELVSRVTGNPAASFNDAIVFPAQRQRVTLSHQTVGLESEECELLEQMSTSLFPRLGIRVVHRDPACARDRASRVPPRITVEALMPVLPPTPQLAPAAGASEPDPSAPAVSETKSSESAPASPEK